MSLAILYHNPRCSKSRQALKFIEDTLLEKKIPGIEIREYLKTPLNIDELSALYKKLKASSAIKSAHDMIRTKEAEYKIADLSTDASDDLILKAIVAYPKLLERPILELKSSAAIGRPIDNIEAIIND